ncbi:MAG: hypothetical protein HZA92_11980 [Verrucomicrobia bacterium]|nr:hypothetical protein [Verrucomicrobiota bacterium]
MTTVQRLAKQLLPKQTADAMEAESRQWRVLCACGHERSIWDLGGIRYKAAGNPRKLMKCPACGKRTWHRVFKQPPVTAGRNAIAGISQTT